MLKNVINDIAKGLKIESPEPTESGEYIFVFDDLLEITLTSLKKDSLIISAFVSDELSNTPETENLFKKMLQLNFIRLKDYEEILTWDPDSYAIVLSKEIPFSDLSEKPILDHLEKFLNSLEFWQAAIAQKANASTSPLPQ